MQINPRIFQAPLRVQQKELEEAKEVLEKTEKTETSQQNTPTPAVSASGAEQLAMIIRQMEMNMSQNNDFSTEKTVEENTGTNSTRAPEETAKATDEDMAEIVDFLNNGRLTKATEKLNNLGISYQLDKPSQTQYPITFEYNGQNYNIEYTMDSIGYEPQVIKPTLKERVEISQDECEDFAKQYTSLEYQKKQSGLNGEEDTKFREQQKQLINDLIQKHGIKSIDADYLLEKIEEWDAQNPGIISNRGLTTELLWFLAGKDAKFEPIDYQPQELPPPSPVDPSAVENELPEFK